MRLGARTGRIVVAAAGVIVLVAPRGATAQTGSLGVGPRFSFVRGDTNPDAASTRYAGGLLRARLSEKTALELAIDYRSNLNEDLTERIRDYPIQGSLLLYLFRSGVAPYALFGAGWYSQRVETLDDDSIISSTTTRTLGYHAGVGGELRLGKRAAVHADYRYTFIRFGEPAAGSTPGAIPLPGLLSVQERLKLSHQGSMWTMGMVFYF